MLDNSREFLSFIMAELAYHSGYLADKLSLKAAVSAVVGFYTGYLLGEWSLLLAWFVLCNTDLVLGIIKALRGKVFNIDVTISWSLKLIVHLLTMLLVGTLSSVSSVALGVDIRFLDCYVGFLIFSEAGSVVKNAKAIGLPVPRILDILLNSVQGAVVKKVSSTLQVDEEELREQLQVKRAVEEPAATSTSGPSESSSQGHRKHADRFYGHRGDTDSGETSRVREEGSVENDEK